MIEFLMTGIAGGYELVADGTVIDVFPSEAMAADMAVRFARDDGTPGYRIFYR